MKIIIVTTASNLTVTPDREPHEGNCPLCGTFIEHGASSLRVTLDRDPHTGMCPDCGTFIEHGGR